MSLLNLSSMLTPPGSCGHSSQDMVSGTFTSLLSPAGMQAGRAVHLEMQCGNSLASPRWRRYLS